MDNIQYWEEKLDSFDYEERWNAFSKLVEKVNKGEITFPPPSPRVNLHFHTFFSFNAYGYSPLHVVWKAKEIGLSMAGSVDFDVLDAVPEFQRGALEVGLPFSSGLETRIYLPEFPDKEFSSPHEPGVAYYMGNGFTRLPDKGSEIDQILLHLKKVAQARNQKVIEKVNAYLDKVRIDYQQDVLPLTPSGNPTERHIVLAYALKSEVVIPSAQERAGFWGEKLGLGKEEVKKLLEDKATFYDFIRSKLIKFGGVGYVKPDSGDFPSRAEVNKLIGGLGAIPSFSWLDGTNSGERDPEMLLEFCLANGIETLFLIPDRAWNISCEEERKIKVAKLYEIVEETQKRDMPVFVGTELNRYGQKLVDDFDSPYLRPLAPYFLESAWTLWGHVVMEMSSQRGYTSGWARENFSSRRGRNQFFASLGKNTPCQKEAIREIGKRSTSQLLRQFGQ
ncbi:MAG TPA: hypothetical protein PK844_00420 [Candidatus Atribacteria bacterium]|nr:hypothetical protein [Candidatus Atribacteria bacterium]